MEQTVSHYRTLRKIGDGGMDVVYEGEDLKLGRHVAPEFLRTPPAPVRMKKRSVREIASMYRV